MQENELKKKYARKRVGKSYIIKENEWIRKNNSFGMGLVVYYELQQALFPFVQLLGKKIKCIKCSFLS